MTRLGVDLDLIADAGLGQAENIFQSGEPQRIAILELSSRACKLMVVDSVRIWSGFNSESFYNSSTLTHMGERLQSNNEISLEAFRQHVLPTITSYVEEAKVQFQADRLYCIATAAYRKAQNRQELLDVFQEIGLNIRVLSRQEEAQATLGSFLWTAPEMSSGAFILIDQGGESTELTLKDDEGNLGHSETIPLGTSTLMRQLFAGEVVGDTLGESLEQVSTLYHSMLFTALRRIQPKLPSRYDVVGVGSAIVSVTGERANYMQHLQSIHRGKITKRLKKIKHQLSLSHKNLQGLSEYFKSIKSKRQDRTREQLVQFVGLHMINTLLKKLGSSKITINGFGLRYGICHQQFIKRHQQFGRHPIPQNLLALQPSHRGFVEGGVYLAKVTNVHPKIGVFFRLKGSCDGLVPMYRFRQYKFNVNKIRRGLKLPVRVERIVFGPNVRIEVSLWERSGERVQISVSDH